VARSATPLKHFATAVLVALVTALALTASAPAENGLVSTATGLLGSAPTASTPTTSAPETQGLLGGVFCPGTTSRPFLRWLDLMQYGLAPGGDFEGSLPWELAGGAKVVAGNEPFKVTRASDARSLSIPGGGSALTAPVCVGLLDPTLRFFAVGGGRIGSSLRVDVIYRTKLGTITQRVATLSTMKSWAPTPPYLFLANVTGLLALDGLTTSVQFRFTASGSGSWQIDDVYVDPFKIH
jgi:hypothetical protein